MLGPGVFPLFPLAALLPLAPELIPDGNGAHPLLDPVIGVALGLVNGPGVLGGQLWILDFLNALVSHPRQPALERFGLAIGPLVELSCLGSGSAALSSSGTIRPSNTLPGSTPHWSKGSMPRMAL